MANHVCNKEREIGQILQEIKDFRKESSDADIRTQLVVLEVRNEVKENTMFRVQAKTIIGFVAFVSAGLGGAIMWLINFLWRN